MAPNTKRVFYVNRVSAQVYLDILAKRPDIHVDRLVNDSPDAEVKPVLAQAHAYQIGSSRQELAMKLQGYAPLLKRCPICWCCRRTGPGLTLSAWRMPRRRGSRWSTRRAATRKASRST